MKHKIVFFDMDGTLYKTEDDYIPDSALQAIQQLKDQGYIVAAATGRPLNQLKLILDKVNFDYYVLINGGYILDSDFNMIDAFEMAQEDVDDIIDYAKENELGLMFHFGDATYIYNDFYPMYYFAKYTNTLDSLFYDPTNTFHRRHAPYNAIVLSKDPDTIDTFMNRHPSLRSDLINVKTDGFAYDIFNAQTDKAHGIELLLNRLGLDWNDVIAFGDSTNDLKMLELADLGIAMASAAPIVQNAANLVTDELMYHGIAKAVQKILEEES
jgi:hypothetical protein